MSSSRTAGGKSCRPSMSFKSELAGASGGTSSSSSKAERLGPKLLARLAVGLTADFGKGFVIFILCAAKDASMVRFSVLHGSEQLFATRYKLVLPTEEELRQELIREQLLLEEKRSDAASASATKTKPKAKRTTKRSPH